ncbi:type III-A CRISPR-associated protein Csm2 [Pseudothermotoga sp.]|nr:type III-A CRISPR-associated protein Csm2 [Pseudothermotoga sp.]MCX7812490.1 type III-A CRISPR-associated protein Csm2 [Pseudothermotoga sp.]MDW8140054.1 type III-A CRISPR-associated protein Csm2 [Pseudothermotoga sp.]
MINLQEIKCLQKLSNWDVSKMIGFSENVAKGIIDKKITITQIRRFHSHITKIWSRYSMNRSLYLKDSEKFKREILDEIIFVKAFLAYQTGRQEELKDLQDVLSGAIDKIQDHQDFEFFKKFYDSIIAYVKYYEQMKSEHYENLQRGGRGR